MSLPDPEPGLVINYSYLWHHEHLAGHEEGTKDRPSVIVLAIDEPSTGEPVVTVLPITHSEPEEGEGIEIPQPVKRALGLDAERSWVIVSEGNDFLWPGYDLRKNRKSNSYAYGLLPPRFFNKIVKAFVAWNQKHQTSLVSRD
ncbi:MAG TPA: hypothetical protein PLW75_02205 [Hyphomicrobium sp.]|nr:hypothetical protein [Hyphomicrobium sp.]